MEVMKTFTARSALLVIAACLSSNSLTRGADEPAAGDSPGPYAKEIRQLKERMGWRQKTVQSFTADF